MGAVESPVIEESDRRELLRIARVTLKEWLKSARIPPGAPHRAALLSHAGAFVTVTVGGVLRGCIGHTDPETPLFRTISDLAIAAATRDPRFPALTLEELPQYFGTEHYVEGRDVIQQGDPGDRFYIVARGRLAVTKTDAAGLTSDVAVLTDGDYFGEISLVRDEPRNATVQALTPSVLLSLSRSHFVRLIARAPALRARIDATIVERS